MNALDVPLKHRDQVYTLIYQKKGIKIDEQLMHVDLTTLFSRLMILERSEILTHCFKFELFLFSTLISKDLSISSLTSQCWKIQ